jgi:hypothetical protein
LRLYTVNLTVNFNQLPHKSTVAVVGLSLAANPKSVHPIYRWLFERQKKEARAK